MHRHPRWGVAAAVAIAVALAISPCQARSHHHHHVRGTHSAAPRAASPSNGQAPAPASVTPGAQQSELGKSGTLAIVFDSRDVLPVLGKVVRSSTGEDMGRLVDVVVDHDGQPRAAIIDFGGFLGVGSRKIAVDWGVLDFSREADKNVIRAELTRDQVKAAPEFKEGGPVVVLGASAGPQAIPAPTPQEGGQKSPQQGEQK